MLVDDYLDYLHEDARRKILSASVATAIAVIAVTFKAYKKMMDGAEKACKRSPDKEACMRTFRHKAYKARIRSLEDKLEKCGNTNAPSKCRRYIRKTIRFLQKRIR